jgi:LuxR family maltose regulon positive regulatory protein
MPEMPGDSRLRVPSLPPGHVARPRLLAALDQVTDAPLDLVSAGPGAGKTVLLADWTARHDMVRWLRLTPRDAAPHRFWPLFAAAFGAPAQDADGIDWIRAAPDLLPAAPVTLVIDGADALTDPDLLDVLDQLIQAGYPRLRLVLCARSDPPLPLHRYRLAGLVREFRGSDLAMTAQEARDLLGAHGVRLTAADLDALLTRTEGWAAGLRLLAMRMQDRANPAECLSELAYDRGSPGEYLMAEVLAAQPEPVRRMLVETSFLDEVTGPLADAVTGLDGCADLLAGLARSNSFVIATDPAGTRFRPHRLFAELLSDLLPRQATRDVPELMTRAAAWFERDGDLERALHLAVRAGDHRYAADLLARGGLAQAFAGRRDLPWASLRDLLARTDAAAGTTEARLTAAALTAATGDARTGDARTAGPGACAIPGPDPGDDPAMAVTADLISLIQALRAGDPGALGAAADALASNPRLPHWPGLLAAVLFARASMYFWHGRHDDAEVLLKQALAAAEASQSHALEADVCAMTAYADSYWARPRHADDAALRVRRIIASRPGLGTPLVLRLAEMSRALTAADFGAAHRALRAARLLDEGGSDPGLGRARVVEEASVLVCAGRSHEAVQLLRAAPREPELPMLDARRDVILAGIETALGRPQGAIRLLRPHHDGGFAGLVAVPRARAYLAMHDWRSAEQCTRSVLAAVPAPAGPRGLVEAMLCEAQIAQAKDDGRRAVEMITDALDVADDEIVLPFLGLTDEFADLLARHRSVAMRWPAPAAVSHREELTGDLVPRTGPVLTDRECAVLRFLMTSMPTAEIASEMCVSVNTVKTHVAAIYRKLGVSKRREAVLRARELELL